MGIEQGPMKGLAMAIADTIYEVGGYLQVRTTAALDIGDASVPVEGTHRWLDSGRIAVGGVQLFYASKTNTSFDGITDNAGNVGVPTDLRERSVVTDITQLSTQTDGLRASFLLAYAQGNELDIIGRNQGISRPRGLDDDIYRALLTVWLFLDATTVYSLEKVLDVLQGPGNYTLYEDLEDFIHRVFVNIPYALFTTPAGQTYLQGLEPAPRGPAAVLTTAYDILQVYGIWVETDVARVGTNYAESVLAALDTAAGTPDRVNSPGGDFIASDATKWLHLIDAGVTERWLVTSFIDVNTIVVGRPDRDDGTTQTLLPDQLAVEVGDFQQWMVGHNIEIKSGPNVGTYPIASVDSPYQVTLTGAVFVTDSDVEWQLQATFATRSPLTARILRATFVGNVITAPAALPDATMLVDYTSVESAQLMTNQVLANMGESPFYLAEEGAVLKQVLDLITAAGVKPIIVLS